MLQSWEVLDLEPRRQGGIGGKGSGHIHKDTACCSLLNQHLVSHCWSFSNPPPSLNAALNPAEPISPSGRHCSHSECSCSGHCIHPSLPSRNPTYLLCCRYPDSSRRDFRGKDRKSFCTCCFHDSSRFFWISVNACPQKKQREREREIGNV